MAWYKINRRWWIDMTQVRAFGKPKDSPHTITIQWKDGQGGRKDSGIQLHTQAQRI